MSLFTGKTVAEAIENGLVTLKVTRNEAKITIISGPQTGLFGRLKKEAEVEVIPLAPQYHAVNSDKIAESQSEEDDDVDNELNLADAPEMQEDEILNMLIFSLSRAVVDLVTREAEEKGIQVTPTVTTLENQIIINLESEQQEQLTSSGGEVINQLQEQAQQFVRDSNLANVSVLVDADGYREKRKRILEKVANRAVTEVKESKEAVFFDPMPPFEREQLREFLNQDPQINAYSKGKGSSRSVIVELKETK